MEPEVIAAIIGLPGTLVVGCLGWRLGVRQTNKAAQAEAMAHFRWAVERIESNTVSGKAAGYVALQTLVTDPYLTDAQRRMMEATTTQLRAITGGTP